MDVDEGDPRSAAVPPALDELREAIQESWDHRTAYLGGRADNRAFGQCYPTARVVQWFYPDAEIVCGDVATGSSVECHFWNLRGNEHIDLSWSQFPLGSTILKWKILDRAKLGDSPPTVDRCDLLLQRVLLRLGRGTTELRRG